MTTKKSSTKPKVKSSAARIVQKSQIITEEDKRKQLKLLQQKEELINGLPHLYGFNLYQFQKEFIESVNRVNLVCAGNQIGKSSCNILKLITLATEPKLWPKFFPERRPIQFWLIGPTKDFLTTEYRTKYVPEFLPRGKFKDHPQYGWKEEIRNKHIWAIHFNTGVSVYMHTYEQDVHHLQGGTVDALFVDEEVPWTLMPELLMRISSTKGMFNASMTPTRGQEQWRQAFEETGEKEIFQGAFKRQVSVYDCLFHADGTPSTKWTEERINQLKNQLGTQHEIDLRIYGRFVAQEGLILSAFRRNLVQRPSAVPEEWSWWSGVDIGGGGGGSLPAIVFIAMRPDFQLGRVVKTWRGETEKIYTASDTLDKYVEMRDGLSMSGEFYDFAAKDFGTIAQRGGVPMQPADKSREIGFPLLNTLFKNSMLLIDDTPDNHLLVNEILSLRHEGNKKTAMDHLCDALRYGAVKIPWSFEGITGERIVPTQKQEITKKMLRTGRDYPVETDIWSSDEELEFYGDLMDPEF